MEVIERAERDVPPDLGSSSESSADAVTTTPMLYDMSRESGNRLRAALLAATNSAASPEARQAAWRRHLQVGDEIKAVDPDDRSDIIAHRRRWRAEYDQLMR